MTDYKKDFPILARSVHSKPLHYIDNAATSQIALPVLDAMREFDLNHRANVHRGVHTLSEESTVEYENARKMVAQFIHAVVPQEIVFVRNTTEACNLIAISWVKEHVHAEDIILISDTEHHSNLIPWQKVCEENGAKLVCIPTDDEGHLHLSSFSTDWSKVKFVALTHVSNVLGIVNDIPSIVKKIKKHYRSESEMPAFFIDGAQAVPHMPVNVQKLGVDFYAFSGHKMCGPMGIGTLWISRKRFPELSPYMTGGGMISEVSCERSSFAQMPDLLEAGTPNVTGAVGLGAACQYLDAIGMENIEKHEKELTAYAYEKLSTDSDITIYGPSDLFERAGLIAFTVKDIPAHDLAAILDTEGVAVRSGQHCVMPWHVRNRLSATTRASFYVYNTKEDVDALIAGIAKAKKIFQTE